MKTDYLIPFRDMGDPRRTQILEWNLARLSWLSSDRDDVIVAHDDNSNDRFNRSQAINAAAKVSDADFLVILDADTIFNYDLIYRALDRMQHKDAKWMIPYDLYLRTDEASGNRVLNNNPVIYMWKDDWTYTHEFPVPPTQYLEPVSGLIICRREDFLSIGGFDERFDGWGWEDRAWVVKADNEIGPHERQTGIVWHIWHPEPIESTEQQPMIAQNKALYEEICNAYV